MKLKSKLDGLFDRYKEKRNLKELSEYVGGNFDNPNKDDCAFTLVAYDGRFSGCIIGDDQKIAELIANACIANSEVANVLKEALKMAKDYDKGTNN